MALEHLKTEEDYRKALAEMEILFGVRPDSPDFVEAVQLIKLITVYEAKNYGFEA